MTVWEELEAAKNISGDYRGRWVQLYQDITSYGGNRWVGWSTLLEDSDRFFDRSAAWACLAYRIEQLRIDIEDSGLLAKTP